MEMSKSTSVRSFSGAQMPSKLIALHGEQINISALARHVLCISSVDYDYSWNHVFDHWGTMAPNWLTIRRDVSCAEGEEKNKQSRVLMKRHHWPVWIWALQAVVTRSARLPGASRRFTWRQFSVAFPSYCLHSTVPPTVPLFCD